MNKITLINIKDRKTDSSNHKLFLQFLFKNNITNEYIIASSVKGFVVNRIYQVNETMLFESDKTGELLNLSELDCTKPALETEQEVAEFVIGYWFPEITENYS